MWRRLRITMDDELHHIGIILVNLERNTGFSESILEGAALPRDFSRGRRPREKSRGRAAPERMDEENPVFLERFTNINILLSFTGFQKVTSRSVNSSGNISVIIQLSSGNRIQRANVIYAH
jgi:hypothetical protein